MIPRFGGLDLTHDPQEVGAEGCVDMLNVDVDKPGRVRTRDGTTAFSGQLSGAASGVTYDITPTSLSKLGVPYEAVAVILSNPSVPRVYVSFVDTAGVETVVSDWPGIHRSFARFGSPTSERLYIAASTASGSAIQLREVSSASATAVAGYPRHIDISGLSNRLVQGGFESAANSPTGANGSKYTVFWSDPGAPTTYGANNYIHFGPGDGYGIEAVKTWGANTFIFKGNCFYVVYGESTGSDGNPIFNYRRVDIEGLLYTTGATGFGCSVGVASDGLYYATTRGVYRTTGGPGQLISDAISPVFTDLASSNHLDAFESLSVSKGRLFLNLKLTGGTRRTFVYDPPTGHWLMWSLPVIPSRFLDWRTNATSQGAQERSYFVTDGKVQYIDPSATTDAGTAIPSHYTSGIYELGEPGHDTYTRHSRPWGYGMPTLSIFTDGGSTDSNAAALTLGTAPTVAEGWHGVSYKGQLFQHQFSANSGAWSVSRLIHDVAWTRT